LPSEGNGSTPNLLSASARFAPNFAATDPLWRAVFHLETAANLLELLERILTISSKCALKSLYNQTGFDSAILRFARAKLWCGNQDLAIGLGAHLEAGHMGQDAT